MHRSQISTFGAVAIVFAVIGVNQGIFADRASLNAMAAGWLILYIVDILWTLYFTSEEDSLALHVFNSLGTGGLTGPGRRRTRHMSVHNLGAGNGGYTAGYSAPGAGIGPGAYDTKSFTAPVRSDHNSFKAPSVDNRGMGGAGSVNNMPGAGTLSTNGGGMENNAGLASPLMGPGNAGVGAGGGPTGQGSPGAPAAPQSVGPADTSVASADGYIYRAKALYACK